MPRRKQAPGNPDESVVESPEVSTQENPKSAEVPPEVAPAVSSQPASKKSPLKSEKLPSGAIIETF